MKLKNSHWIGFLCHNYLLCTVKYSFQVHTKCMVGFLPQSKLTCYLLILCQIKLFSLFYRLNEGTVIVHFSNTDGVTQLLSDYIFTESKGTVTVN